MTSQSVAPTGIEAVSQSCRSILKRGIARHSVAHFPGKPPNRPETSRVVPHSVTHPGHEGALLGLEYHPGGPRGRPAVPEIRLLNQGAGGRSLRSGVVRDFWGEVRGVCVERNDGANAGRIALLLAGVVHLRRYVRWSGAGVRLVANAGTLAGLAGSHDLRAAPNDPHAADRDDDATRQSVAAMAVAGDAGRSARSHCLAVVRDRHGGVVVRLPKTRPSG